MLKALLTSAASLTVMSHATLAFAQQQGPASTGPAPSTAGPTTQPKTDTAANAPQPGSTQLGEVVVTAQRRSENLQRAAVPVDVISASDVLQSGATDATGLTTVVPALSVSPNGGGTTSFFIRGVGNFSSNPLFEPAIAFNFDNVYIGRATATAGLFYDLERIEVLKGPQGTLYGRNATGGAINVDPVLPKLGTFSGYLTGSYGNYDAGSFEGAVNMPIGDRSAFRISATYSGHSGYLSDGTSDQNQGGVRAQFLTEITPKLTLRLSGDYERIGGIGVGASYANGLRYNAATNSFAVQGSGLSRSTGLYDPASQAFRSTLAETVAGRNLAPLPIAPYLNNAIYGTSAEIGYNTGFGKLTVIPSYRYSTVDTITDAPGFPAGIQTKDQQYSVEARFAGTRISIFDYTLGALYYYERNKDIFAIDQQTLLSTQNNRESTKSYSAFARLTANVTDRLRLVGGLRYTQDNKTYYGQSDNLAIVCVVPSPVFPRCPAAPQFPFTWTVAQQTTIPVPPPGPPAFIPSAGTLIVRSGNLVDASLDKGKATYRAAIEYDVAPRSLAYASFETGFRSGGFSEATGYETYQPETIKAWTVGSKNRFLDNRLQLNVEGYYWEYSNQQLAHIGVDLAGQNGNFTQNIGSSTIYGADVESRLAVTSTLIVNAQLQYLHTRDDQFNYNVPTGAVPITGCAVSPAAGNGNFLTINCAGKPALNSPKWTLNLGADKTFKVGDYKVVASIDSQFRTSRYVGFEYQAAELQTPTWQTNLQLLLAPDGDRWSLAAFVRNVENDRYTVNAQYFLFGNGLAYLTAPPRTYGARASLKF